MWKVKLFAYQFINGLKNSIHIGSRKLTDIKYIKSYRLEDN